MKGQQRQRLYWVWAAMKGRCLNPNDKGYYNYGGRGITVCQRWSDSFECFEFDMGYPSKGLSLERIDNDGNYEPANCRWATRQEQNRNRSHCRYHSLGGRRVTMREAWEQRLDPHVTYRSFVKRLVTRGWTLDRALNQPVDPRGGV